LKEEMPSLFYVPTTEQEAKQELSYMPGVYAALVKRRKELRIQELNLEKDLDKIRDNNYFKERLTQSQKDAEKASKLTGDYETVYREYVTVYSQREEVEGYLKAIEMKNKALNTIISAEIGDKFIQR
jgi:hypothetical protein